MSNIKLGRINDLGLDKDLFDLVEAQIRPYYDIHITDDTLKKIKEKELKKSKLEFYQGK